MRAVIIHLDDLLLHTTLGVALDSSGGVLFDHSWCYNWGELIIENGGVTYKFQVPTKWRTTIEHATRSITEARNGIKALRRPLFEIAKHWINAVKELEEGEKPF